ncbi:UNVERIFIED_CONTAM: hypothetical protein GTU68_010976 [Idotea baltica]|nr:hypothetical protein [Idotea baltica]
MENKFFSLNQLAGFLNASIYGDKEFLVKGLAPLSEADNTQLSFLSSPQYRKYLKTSLAGAVILAEKDLDYYKGNALVAEDPYLAYAKISHLFDIKPAVSQGVHPTAVIADTAAVATSASIGPYVVIHSDARIGKNSWIAPRVTLYHDVVVGHSTVVQSGAVIGGEGFGFAKSGKEWQKIAQLGGVIIGDNVEIGANTTIDRGALSNTLIGDGVKLDNQIMIAHNVQVGDHTAMAACVGISGSTKIGKHCMIAGGVGMVGHIDVCDNVFVTGMTMVTRSITKPGVYSSGTAMQPVTEWRKSAARIRQLDDMAKRLHNLEKCFVNGSLEKNALSDA